MSIIFKTDFNYSAYCRMTKVIQNHKYMMVHSIFFHSRIYAQEFTLSCM